MSICNSFQSIKSVNTYRKTILTAFTVALIIGLFAGCEEAHTPTTQPSVKLKEPIELSASTLAKINEYYELISELVQIEQLVMELEYPEEVAVDFANMVFDWRDAQRRLVLIAWKKKLANAKEEYEQGKISETQLAKVEEKIAKEISQRIQKEIGPNEKFFDLADVVKNKQAQCLGYTQLFYVLGNSFGLSVRVIDVLELMTAGPTPSRMGHIACIVSLSDGKTMMVDLVKGDFISKSFIIEEQYTKVGNYWELKSKNNPLKIHRRFQILDRNGLIAHIYSNRGIAYKAKGEYDLAISDFTKAIKINPKYSTAYSNRGVVYAILGKAEEAKKELLKAVELNPALKAKVNKISDKFKLDLDLNLD